MAETFIETRDRTWPAFHADWEYRLHRIWHGDPVERKTPCPDGDVYHVAAVKQHAFEAWKAHERKALAACDAVEARMGYGDVIEEVRREIRGGR